MTLYRQLALTILIVFSAGFLGTVAISTGNLRLFLARQLQTQAQDTATSLGLSLSRPMAEHDLAVMNAMVDAIFHRGDYQSIAVVSPAGDLLVERQQPAGTPGIPRWFTRYTSLDVPAAEARVMDGWKPAATVRVRSHPGLAYRELWSNTVETMRLYVLAALALLVLGLLAVNRLVKPLRAVESQAEKISRGHYAVQDRLPRTRELRSVVVAINRLACRARLSFARQAAVIEKLRQQAFMDALTGLGNRRYFEQQLGKYLRTGAESQSGELILLAINHLELVNLSSGFPAGDRLLRKTGELITLHTREFTNCETARVSGSGFAIIASGLARPRADKLARKLSAGLLQLYCEQLVENKDIAAIGLTGWGPGEEVSRILARAEQAVRYARSLGDNAVFRYDPANNAPAFLATDQWRAFLGEIIRNRQTMLFAQPVVASGSNHRTLLQQETYLRIRDRHGDDITAAVFMPMAEHTGYATEFDKLAIDLVIEHIRSAPSAGPVYAVNLTATSLHDPQFRQWLYEKLAADSECAARLAIEIPEPAVLRDIRTARTFLGRLAGLHCSCGIDHFGHGFHSFGYLSDIGASYLKIDSGYIPGIESNADNRFLVRTLVEVAHRIDLRVIAGCVETAAEQTTLESLKVDGLQGYWLAKPELLPAGGSNTMHGKPAPSAAESGRKYTGSAAHT